MTRMAKRRPARAGKRQEKNPDVLTDAELLFALHYLETSNATDAYRNAHPNAKDSTARVEGFRTLIKPRVQAFVKHEREKQFKRLRINADEALALISGDATADIRKAYGKDGSLLAVKDWPDELVRSVRAIRHKEWGQVDITLNDSLKARELLAIAGGKLRQGIDHRHAIVSLADLLDPTKSDEELERRLEEAQ